MVQGCKIIMWVILESLDLVWFFKFGVQQRALCTVNLSRLCSESAVLSLERIYNYGAPLYNYPTRSDWYKSGNKGKGPSPAENITQENLQKHGVGRETEFNPNKA